MALIGTNGLLTGEQFVDTFTKNTFVGDGSTTDWTLTVTAPSAESLLVKVNNSIYHTSEYSVSGTTLTISPAVTTSYPIEVVHLGKQKMVFTSPAILDNLNDVIITTPSTNQALKYDGTQWVNGTVSSVGVLDDLTDVIITTPSNGQGLVYNGTNWVNSAIAGGGGLQSIWVPADAMISRYSSGAAYGQMETITNKINYNTLDFDPSTIEYAQFTVQMPKSWDESTITYKVVWSHVATGTTHTVAWAAQAVALSDTDAFDVAFGSAVQVNDTGGTTDTVYISPISSALTIGGSPVENDFVVFQIYRNATDATNDAMPNDARLHGITILYNTNTGTDA